jgi:hypothetical protein
MSRTIQRMDVGKHIRIWEDERDGFVSWSDGSKTFEEAQLLGMQVFLHPGDYDARWFIVAKLSARRWQVIMFGSDRGISL